MNHLKMTEMCDKKACELIKNALNEECNIAITGLNDTGKSVFLRAIVAKIDKLKNIRLFNSDTVDLLRQMYPERNIIGFESLNLIVRNKDWHYRVDEIGVILLDNVENEYIATILDIDLGELLFVVSNVGDFLANKMVSERKRALIVRMSDGTVSGLPCVDSIEELIRVDLSSVSREQIYSRQ